MIRKILIHIGFHKTATSTIKHSLIENDQQLRLRGVLYPQSGRRAHNHHDLALQLNEDPRFMPKFGGLEELVTEINLSNPVKVIISSEHLSISTPERISQLKKWLEPLGEIKIIAFVRRQDLWLQSLWAQLTRTGPNTNQFDDFVGQVLEMEVSIESDPVEEFVAKISDPDFNRRLAPWENPL